MNHPTSAQIAALAYQLYVEDGKPEGEAETHWHRAVEILTRPEIRSDENILSLPSEPELGPTLDAKAETLDGGLPSDPHSGKNAYHQRIEVAVEARDKKAVLRIQQALRSLRGIERVQSGGQGTTVQIFFDARRTNPAAIHEAISGSGTELDPRSVLEDNERD